MPSDIRSAYSLEVFNKYINFWTKDKCPCKLCKMSIGNVGFNYQCSKEIGHTIYGVTLSSFPNVLLYICNFLRLDIDE